VHDDTAERIRGQYRFRASRFRARYDGVDSGGVEERSADYQRLRRELLETERQAVVDLRNRGIIEEEVMHRVQRDIDLETSRLDL
jgi:CPA1 family monovalent cation:H+ antiporter